MLIVLLESECSQILPENLDFLPWGLRKAIHQLQLSILVHIQCGNWTQGRLNSTESASRYIIFEKKCNNFSYYFAFGMPIDRTDSQADTETNRRAENKTSRHIQSVIIQTDGQSHTLTWQGPVLLTFLRHVARISVNGIAALKESCSPIG